MYITQYIVENGEYSRLNLGKIALVPKLWAEFQDRLTLTAMAFNQ